MTLDEPRERSYTFLGMTAIVVSEAMHHLLELVERMARSSASVLITGESGVGKEAVARAVHHYSPRGHKPWVDLSCAALPEHLLESELFGHERGAFSGADTAKPGLFELAHQGTIFLDEVGELDPRMQVKLLRVLDGVPYYRLGGTKKVSSDVRVVAATNQDLERAVAEGRFRGDLYHRLSQCTLCVPPLRTRIADIEPLARYFLTQHDSNMRLSRSAIEVLEAHSWPGNIRELRNTVLQAGVLAGGPEIGENDFRLRTVSAPPVAANQHHASQHHSIQHHASQHHVPQSPENGGSLESMERRMIQEALSATGGHQQKAAARLGISRRTLSRKLRGYESESEQMRAAQ
ncbi:MAG: sigma-54 interaction domain-containing protein [Bryobacteraceae bacterium]